MADKNIGLLPQASTLTDNSSFVCEDSGIAKRVTGKQFKDFAKEGALPAVKAAESAADRADVALTKAPKIQNGTWWVFDASSQAYVDTGVKAQGERGIQGERGEPGQPGEKGDPFRYEDFTPEQLDDLERGAKAAQAAAEMAAASAATSAGQASVSEQNAAGSASAAKASEDAAKASETAAAGSASSAQESAASASASASEASASATAAAVSETSAVEAKTAAETAKTEAGKSASAAKKSETASKASETAAAGSASVAQQSASAAEGSATAAAQSAASIGNAEQVVTQKAEEASTSAANAAASAEAAARSAEQAEEVVGGNFATKSEAKGYANTAESNAKSYTDQKISAIPTPDVSGQIGEHNTNTEAHNDIRDLITGLTNRLNALANSDDTTLDQLSEIVAYIKSNRSLIDNITTSKVNVADIIDNLTTNVSNKPLSAAQGVALKALIDAITASEVGAYTKDETNTLLQNKLNIANPESTGVFYHKGNGAGNTGVVLQIQSNNGVLRGYGDSASSFHLTGVPVAFDNILIVKNGLLFQTSGQSLDFNGATINNISQITHRGSKGLIVTGCDFNDGTLSEEQNHNFVVKNSNIAAGLGASGKAWSYQSLAPAEDGSWKRVFGVRADGIVYSNGKELATKEYVDSAIQAEIQTALGGSY